MARSQRLILLAVLAACGDEGWSFDFVDGPLDGEHAVAFRVSGSGAHLVEPGQRGSQSLSGAERWVGWDLAPAGDRVAWVQNPEVDEPARWVTQVPEPETDHYLLHSEWLGDRPTSRTTFAVPCAPEIALSPDGRLAFGCGQDLFVSDPEGKRIVRVARGLDRNANGIRWVR